MENTTLKIEKRDEIGGRRPRRLREHGLIPAVVYGRGMASSAAQVKASDLREFLKNNMKNTVFTTEFAEEQDFSVLIKDIQYDAGNREIVHLDFQKVNQDEKIQVEVPVKIIGGDVVKKAGNVVVHQLNTVTVECFPRDIPQHADADISDLMPGHSFTAGKIKFSQGVSLLSRPDEIVLTVIGHGQEAEQ